MPKVAGAGECSGVLAIDLSVIVHRRNRMAADRMCCSHGPNKVSARVVEVNRGDRRTRRAAGKSDTIDAEVAARSVIGGSSRRPRMAPSR